MEVSVRPDSIANLETIRYAMLQSPGEKFMVEMDVSTVDYLRERIELSYLVEKTGFERLSVAVNRLADTIGGKEAK